MPLIEFSLRSLAVLTSLFWIFCSFSTSMAFHLVLASIMTDPSLLRMQSKSSLSFLFKSSYISKLSKGIIWRDTFEGIKVLSSLQNASIRPLARHTQEEKKVLGLGAAIIMRRCSLLNRRSLKVSFITL